MKYTTVRYSLNTIALRLHLRIFISQDVDQLYKELGNPFGKFRVPHEQFNHLDFMWAKDVKELLYDKILSLMTNFQHWTTIMFIGLFKISNTRYGYVEIAISEARVTPWKSLRIIFKRICKNIGCKIPQIAHILHATCARTHNLTKIILFSP